MGLFSFGKGTSSDSKRLSWEEITSIAELEKALSESSETPALFFKHSTRCSISSMALNRFENDWDESKKCNIYFIDLIAHRDVSNALSDQTNIQHQSPQVIVVDNGLVIYNASHSSIDANEIQSKL